MATAVTAVLAPNYFLKTINKQHVYHGKHETFCIHKVQCVCDNYLFFNKCTVYCMLHWNNIRTATEYFTHLHNTEFVCAMNICLDQCITVFNKIYQISALSQDEGNVMPK